MKRISIVLFVLLLTLYQSNAEELTPFSRALNIGDKITISGELVVFNGWEPSIRFITEQNEIIGIGKDKSEELSEDVNEIIQQFKNNGITNKIIVNLEYIGNISVPYYSNPLMCFSINRIIQRVYLDAINNVKLGNKIIKVYQPNYNKKDLVPIINISDGNSVSCLWGINRDYIDKQKIIDEPELVNKIDLNRYIENANYFIQNAYDNLWHNNLYLSSFTIQTINKDNTEHMRNDWFLVFTYKTDINSDVENEKIFMLPDGVIIISSSNYEGIKYYK